MNGTSVISHNDCLMPIGDAGSVDRPIDFVTFMNLTTGIIYPPCTPQTLDVHYFKEIKVTHFDPKTLPTLLAYLSAHSCRVEKLNFSCADLGCVKELNQSFDGVEIGEVLLPLPSEGIIRYGSAALKVANLFLDHVPKYGKITFCEPS